MEGTDLGAVAEQGQREELEKAPFPLVLFLPSLMLREGESQCLGLWPSTEDAMVSG